MQRASLWWTVAVTDGADDRSPWTRDDWTPDDNPPVDFAGLPSPRDRAGSPGRSSDADSESAGAPALTWRGDTHHANDSDGDGEPDGRRTAARTLIAAGAVVLALVVGFTVLVGDDAGDGRDGAAAPAATDRQGDDGREGKEGQEGQEGQEGEDPVSSVDGTAVDTTVRRTTVTTLPMSVSVRSVDPDDEERPEIVSVVTSRPAPNALELGLVPEWTMWMLPPAHPLDAITEGTEMVLVARGQIHRIEVPSGAVRSLDIDGQYDPGASFAVAGTNVALAYEDELTLIPEGHSAVRIELGRIQSLRARPDQGDFIVEVERAGVAGWGLTDILVVSPTGVVTSSIPGRPSSWWSTIWLGDVSLTPAGEVVLTAPGGVYAVDPTGASPARRLSEGGMAGRGRNHVLIERCDEQLACGYELLDLRTGETSPVVATVAHLAPYAPMSVSPDGGRVAFVTVGDEPTPTWHVVDLTTGEIVFRGGENTWFGSESWTADGDAFVLIENNVLRVQTLGGGHAEITGFGSPNQVIVQPAPTWRKNLEPER